MVDAQRPCLEVRDHAMHPGQDDMRRHSANDVGLVLEPGQAGVGAPAVGLEGGARGDVGLDERMKAGRRGVLDRPQAQAPGSLIDDFDGDGDLHLAVRASPASARQRVILGPAGHLRFVDLDHAGQERTGGIDHGPAQLGAQEPGTLVGAQAQLPPHLPRGNAVRVGGHQIGGPKPYRERQLRAVHHRPCRDRRLPATLGALIGPRLGGELPGTVMSAGRATETLRPTSR